ncbi:MAG: DUF4942 domain-containing protein [Verrucomicrobia bacterium]|nr:DUF4942 domain-containing protein [Verrucomicrobiota bacterium]
MTTTTELATRKTVEELVREWNMGSHLLRTGLETLKLAETHFRAFDGPGSHYDLCLFTHHEHSVDFDRKITRLKAAAWRYLVDRIELKKLASVKRAGEIDRQINAGTDLPDITMDNLMGWLQSLGGQAKNFLEEAIVEVFEFLRPPSLRYKTNSGFKVGKRVILCNRVEKAWTGARFRVSYHYENELRALDNVFHLLDGAPLSAYRNGDLINAILESADGKGETGYFRFKSFLNGNLHLEFRRMDLVQRLNEVGGNGLPMPGRH